jgi:hypothetical protein
VPKRWKIDAQAAEDLAYDLDYTWGGEVSRGTRGELLTALSIRLGSDFKIGLLTPVAVGGKEDGRRLLLVGEHDDVVLVTLNGDDATRLDFLGSLAGGRYSEVVSFDEHGRHSVEGTFSHERLAEPFTHKVMPPPDQREDWSRPGFEGSLKRQELLLDYFRRWAEQPPRATR